MMYERGEWFQNQTLTNGIYITGVRCIPKMINLASFPGFSLTFWSHIVQLSMVVSHNLRNGPERPTFFFHWKVFANDIEVWCKVSAATSQQRYVQHFCIGVSSIASPFTGAGEVSSLSW